MNAIINFLFYAVRAGTPLLLGTTGEIITEKSGSMNLGVEGMMAVGAITGYYFGCLTNNILIALLSAFIAAALCGLIFAFLTITLQSNQNVTGLALTTFGVGVYTLIGRSLTQSSKFPALEKASSLVAFSKDTGIPFLRDIPFVGKLLFSYNYFVYLAVAIAIVLWIYVAKTKQGLRLRAVGENPGPADACGVNITFYKYFHAVLGAGICGIGGLYMALVTNGGAWNESWINGFGWISVALVIFAKWNTLIAVFGSCFFGVFNALQAWKGNLTDAFPKVFGWLSVLPNEFYQMLPFLITAVVLIISSITQKKHSAAPSHVGINYFREDR